jgi:hypothetical protein
MKSSVGAALGDQFLGIVEQPGDGRLDLGQVILEGDPERQPHVGGDADEFAPFLGRQAQEVADHPGGVGFAEFGDEVAAAAVDETVDQPVGEGLEFRLQLGDQPGAEGRVGHPPQPGVGLALDAEQHVAPPAGESAGRHVVVLRPQMAALAQLRMAQELLHLVVAQHGQAVGRAREPALGAGVLDGLRAHREGGVGDVEKGRGGQGCVGHGGGLPSVGGVCGALHPTMQVRGQAAREARARRPCR